MDQNTYQERFNQLYSLFTEAFWLYHTWKGLREEKYEKVFERNGYFWQAVFLSLQNAWMLNLARIYEKSKYAKNDEVVSVSKR